MSEKTYYELNREKKKCISCPNPATDTVRCDDCRRKRRERHAALAKAKKCVDCKKKHGEAGVRCLDCKAKHAALYHQRKAAGVCPHDGNPSAGKPGTVCASCNENNRRKDRKKYAKLRVAVFAAYTIGAVPSCACCGETTTQFLQIDHKNNDGGRHRRELSGKNQGCNIYTWLRKNKYPPGFQILCSACNSAKGFYGICPHEQVRQQHAITPFTDAMIAEIEARDPRRARLIRDALSVLRR
jgi:hypothetical protein